MFPRMNQHLSFKKGKMTVGLNDSNGQSIVSILYLHWYFGILRYLKNNDKIGDMNDVFLSLIPRPVTNPEQIRDDGSRCVCQHSPIEW